MVRPASVICGGGSGQRSFERIAARNGTGAGGRDRRRLCRQLHTNHDRQLTQVTISRICPTPFKKGKEGRGIGHKDRSRGSQDFPRRRNVFGGIYREAEKAVVPHPIIKTLSIAFVKISIRSHRRREATRRKTT